MKRSIEEVEVVERSVPIWFAPIDGPVTGALVFRVGIADEDLAQRGLTHLVEHLAMHGLQDPSLTVNAFVDLNRTVFHATGPQAAVERHLARVCAQLADLPLHRLVEERRVLGAEARSRGYNVVNELFSQRFGAVGWGSIGWWEMGIPEASAQAVGAWAGRYFTRENAAMWMTARPSDDLHLELGEGIRMPVPSTEAVRPGRHWFRSDVPQVSFLSTIERSVVNSVAAGLLGAELHTRLREQGLTYGVANTWYRLSDRGAAVTMVCSAVPAREHELARALLSTTDDLCTSFPQSALDGAKQARDAAHPDDIARAWLDVWALDHLLGAEPMSFRADDAALAAMSVEEVREAIRQLRSEMLVQVPSGVGLKLVDLPPIDPISSDRMPGRSTRLVHFNSKVDAATRLEWNDEGIALRDRRGNATIRWSDVACTMQWRDGVRVLVARDGDGLKIVPRSFRHSDAVVAAIDSAPSSGSSVLVGARNGVPGHAAVGRRALKLSSLLRSPALLLPGPILALVVPPGTPLTPRVVLAVAPIALLTLTTSAPRSIVWDNSHTRTKVPDHLPRAAWAMPGGLLLGWATLRRHLSDWAEAAFAEDIALFRAGDITGPELYRRSGGVLATDVFDRMVNEFFTDYLAQRSRGYDLDLKGSTTAPNFFEIPDDAASQDAVVAVLDKRFQTWRRFGRFAVIRRVRRVLRAAAGQKWSGPQSTEFVARVAHFRYKVMWYLEGPGA